MNQFTRFYIFNVLRYYFFLDVCCFLQMMHILGTLSEELQDHESIKISTELIAFFNFSIMII